MYQGLLTRKYLTRKIMPLLSAVAVALCTAMVLVTWSVMGGFLNTLLTSGRAMMGDVKIEVVGVGFPYYEELIEALEAHDDLVAAAPAVEWFGQLGLPHGRVAQAAVWGVDPERYARVTHYADALHWRPIDAPTRRDTDNADPRLVPASDYFTGPGVRSWESVLQRGLTLTAIDERTNEPVPGIALGIRVSGQSRSRPGWYEPVSRYAEDFLPFGGRVTLVVLPSDSQGRMIEPRARIVPVVNEIQSGIAQVDGQTAITRIDLMQDLLGMRGGERVVGGGGFGVTVDPETGEERFSSPETVSEPARATTVFVRGRDGLSLDRIVEATRESAEAFINANSDRPQGGLLRYLTLATWEDINAQFVAAVKKEIGLVLFLFSFISLTAVFLVWSIFWSMVNEKTKDIGILRAIGASRRGVAWLWLRYALSIGVVGSALGLAISYLIVRNINAIHDWMGSALGLSIWDPSIYLFAKIPDKVDPLHAAMVGLGGVLAAVFGAMVPAIRASRMDPVRALRFE